MVTDIKRNHEHWEVYVNGKLYCTADSKSEAERDLQEYLESQGV